MSSYGYSGALQAAGAVVLEFRAFGSYQGDWYALVDYKGERGWIRGCYGSCSHCDAFESEFGWSSDDGCDEHPYSSHSDCADCKAKADEYQTRLASFGRSYCDGLQSADTICAELDERGEWDSESEEAARWIRSVDRS